MPLLCCDVGLVSELRLTAGCVLMDLASPAVSGTSVYANGLNCWTSSLDISGYHVDFHEGHSTVRAGQGSGMACVN